MIDFTSSLYLGVRHSHASLAPWTSLTTGVPAALREPDSAREAAAALARLQGCEASLLATSTLHAFWDLFGMIGDDVDLLVDEGLYAVGRAGVERASGRGVPVRWIAHYDEASIRRAAGECARRRRRPVLVCDGVCPHCGRVAPLGRVVRALEAHRGHAIVDDTQGLGIIGHAPSARRPLGIGGGGSLRHQGVTASDTIVIASLAKAFGAPVAAISGRSATIRRYAARSEARVHSSPASLANVHAAVRALRLNRHCGERLRGRLVENTVRFRKRAARAGVPLTETFFPVQTVETQGDGTALHRALLGRGIATVLRPPRDGGPGRVTLIVTAGHSLAQIEEAVNALAFLDATLQTTYEDDDDVDHTRRIHLVSAALSRAAHGATL